MCVGWAVGCLDVALLPAAGCPCHHLSCRDSLPWCTLIINLFNVVLTDCHCTPTPVNHSPPPTPTPTPCSRPHPSAFPGPRGRRHRPRLFRGDARESPGQVCRQPEGTDRIPNPEPVPDRIPNPEPVPDTPYPYPRPYHMMIWSGWCDWYDWYWQRFAFSGGRLPNFQISRIYQRPVIQCALTGRTDHP